LLFNFALEYAITRDHVNQVDLKLNGTHQLLVCAYHVNIFGDGVSRKTETLRYLLVKRLD
jgi:hypothetical protein